MGHKELSVFAHLLDVLNRRSDSFDGEEPELPDEVTDRLEVRMPGLVVTVLDVIEFLDNPLEPPLPAAWMAGYARVAAVLPDEESRIVIATPLYVEYAPQPPTDQ